MRQVTKLAPGRDASYVARQPGDEAALHRARMALVACPVGAIGTESKHAFGAARSAFPEPIEDGVYYCGWAAESSYGARSYLIVRPGGNILVDSPRYAAPLVERMEVLGGVRWMFLTHRDDVADHRKFRDRFGRARILHRADVAAGTRDVEIALDGNDPLALDEEALFIPVPGHTPGSTCLLYRGRFLFSGDHAWWDARRERVNASRSVCWYDWDEQTASMQRLAAYRFEWLLPTQCCRARRNGRNTHVRMREGGRWGDGPACGEAPLLHPEITPLQVLGRTISRTVHLNELAPGTEERRLRRCRRWHGRYPSRRAYASKSGHWVYRSLE